MKTGSHLDWLQFTFPSDFDLANLVQFTGKWSEASYVHKNYQAGFKSEIGVMAYTGHDERMGTFVMFTGEPLQTIRTLGVTDRELVQFGVEHQGRSSRLDMTINLVDCTLTVAKVVRSWRRGWVKSKAKDGTEDKGVIEPGHTLYMGSKKSDRMVRIYDKFAETKVKNPAAFELLKQECSSWVRFEIQCRNDWANGFRGAIAEHDDTSAIIKAAMREFIQWENLEYQEATLGPDVALPELPRKVPNFWNWIADQVVPASVKFELENEGTNVKSAFGLLFDQEMKKQCKGK